MSAPFLVSVSWWKLHHFRSHYFYFSTKISIHTTGGIIYIRHGNLTADEEVYLVKRFFMIHPITEFNGKLATLYKDSVKIR